MSDASACAVCRVGEREQFRLAERTAAMTAQALVPHAQKSRPEAAKDFMNENFQGTPV